MHRNGKTRVCMQEAVPAVVEVGEEITASKLVSRPSEWN